MTSQQPSPHLLPTFRLRFVPMIHPDPAKCLRARVLLSPNSRRDCAFAYHQVHRRDRDGRAVGVRLRRWTRAGMLALQAHAARTHTRSPASRCAGAEAFVAANGLPCVAQASV